jgi:CRISPR type I-D-associated protein Csc2
MNNVKKFKEELPGIKDVLEPIVLDKKTKVVKASMVKRAVSIVGLKTATTRFLPVSHEGYSTDTYIDRVDVVDANRAEFIGRKMKGIERRAHMSMFRELLEDLSGKSWQDAFQQFYGKECIIPDGLCLACWNCSLFGGLEAGKGATFSRIRYFDTFSVEPTELAVAMEGSDEGMAIGNTVSEDLSKKRGSDSYHQYEYVKAGTHFPFITIIENPTYLDVIGYLKAVKIADIHGYGKYSANHGKFDTQFLAVSTGFPRFSVLDMLEWAGNDYSIGNIVTKFDTDSSDIEFEGNTSEPITILGAEIEDMTSNLAEEFKEYLDIIKG